MDFFPFAPDMSDPKYVQWRMGNDIREIRQLAESTELVPQPVAGPAEYHISFDLADQFEQIAEADRQAAFEHGLHMEQIGEHVQEGNLVLTDIRDYLRSDLTKAAAKQLARLEGIQDAVESLSDDLYALDARAETRHKEMLKAIRSPNGNRANERYHSALTHFRAGEMAEAAQELRKAFKQVSTHTPSWILSARIYQHRGRADLARAAFDRAATYAHLDGFAEDHAIAVIGRARLEATVGNFEVAYQIIDKAVQTVGDAGVFYPRFILEHVRMCVMDREEDSTAEELARDLDPIVVKDPAMLDEIASDPFWAEILKVRPGWRFGNAPYWQLPSILPTLKVHLPDGRDWPIIVSGDSTFEEAFNTLQGGKVAHPYSVSAFLNGLLQFKAQQGETAIIDGNWYFSGLEELVLCVAAQYPALAPNSGLIYPIVYRSIGLWEGPAWSGMLFPNLHLRMAKVLIAGPHRPDQLLPYLDRILPNVVRAHPHVRDQLAREPEFRICRERRAWMKLGNTSHAPLLEAIEGIEREWNLFDGWTLPDLWQLKTDIREGRKIDSKITDRLLREYRRRFHLTA